MADRLVIETSLLIEFHHGKSDAVAYLDDLLLKNIAIVHPVSAAEMLHGARDQHDMRDIARFLVSFRRIAVKSIDHEYGLQLVMRHRLSHGVGWPDCLIAATCIRLGLPLVTLNDKHFRPFGPLTVIRPY